MPDSHPHIASWRVLPVQALALFTFILMPMWYRVPADTPIFGTGDVTRFAAFIPAALSIVLWIVMGLPGLEKLFSGWRAVWASCLAALTVWTYASSAWAQYGANQPELANNAAITWMITTGFAVVVASIGLPSRAIVLALMFGVAWNGILAAQQVAVQGSAGGLWTVLKEFPIGVELPRISVVQADGVRWLRPYGLLPHPNVLAGFLVVGLLACASYLAETRFWRWLITTLVWSIGLWALLLTFSRGAYLAFAVGGILLLILLYRAGRWTRGLVAAAVVTLILGVMFAALYHPFLLARVGDGNETTEQYSLGERAMLNGAAVNAIHDGPILGIGGGNMPWYSAYWLYERESPIQGNYPHNVGLTLWAELGIVGLFLWAGCIGSAMIAAFKMLAQKPADRGYRAALLAGFVAFIVTGLTEYYPVTMVQFMLGGWGMVAAALTPTDRPMLESVAFTADQPHEGR